MSYTGGYPEHLNPFHEEKEKRKFWKLGRKNSFSSTFKDLRSTLTLKSFRGKKKTSHNDTGSPIQIRRYPTLQSPVSRQTFPSSTATLEFPRSSTSTPVLLPRSRFSERVTKSSSVEGLSNGKLPTCSVTPATPIEGLNPFDDDDVAPVPAPRRTKRRRKRTAPRPPGREDGDESTLGQSSLQNSKWSIMSGETDFSSCSAYSGVSEDESPANVSSEMTDVLHRFNEHMERLTDDLEKEDEHPQMPDLIPSKKDATGNLDVEKEKLNETEASDIKEDEAHLECTKEIAGAEEVAIQKEDPEKCTEEEVDKTDPVCTINVETNVEVETPALPKKTEISPEDVVQEAAVHHNVERTVQDETEPVQDNVKVTTDNKVATVPDQVEVSKNEAVLVQELQDDENSGKDKTSVKVETPALPEKTEISPEYVVQEAAVHHNLERTVEDETEPVLDNVKVITENKVPTVPDQVEVSKNETEPVQEELQVDVESVAAPVSEEVEVTDLQADSVKEECVEVQERTNEPTHKQPKDCQEQLECHLAEADLNCNGNGESEEIPFIDDVCLNGTRDNDLLSQSSDHNANEVFEELDDANGNRKKNGLPKSRTHKFSKSALLGEEEVI